MADLRTKITLDTSQFVSAMSDVRSAAASTAKSIQDGFKAAAPTLDTGKLAKGFSDLQTVASKAVNEQKAALAQLIQSGTTSGAAYDNVKKQLSDAVKEAKRLQDAVKAVDKEVADLDSKPISIGDKIKQSLGGALSGGLVGGIVGGGVAGIASTAISAIQSAATAAFDEYRALDKNIQNIGTLGVEAAGLSLQKFEGLITDLSRKTPDTASNIANGVYNAISAGITGTEEEIVKFVETASRVAVAGLSDTNQAVNGLTSVVNAYGTGAKGAREASNIFFATIKAGKTSFNELNAGLANVIPAASAANVSFTEVGASIAKLTTVGIPTAQATTQIRAALIELQKPAKPLEQALTKAFGSPQAAVEKLKAGVDKGGGLMAVLQQLQVSAEESGQSLTQIFGSAEAASAALSLTGKNAESALNILKGVQADIADDVADKAFDAAAKGLDVKFNILKNNIQATFNDIFRVVIPVISTVVDLFTNSLGPVFSSLFSTLGGTFQRIWSVIKPILAAIGGALIFNIVQAITTIVTQAQVMFRVFNQVFDGIVRALKPIADAFSEAFGGIGEGLDPVKVFGDVLQGLTLIITEAGGVIGDFAGIIVEVLIIPLEIVGNAIAGIVRLFSSQNKETKDVKKNTEALKSPLELIRGVFDNIRGTLGGVTVAFREVKEVIGEFFVALRSLDFSKIGDILSGAGKRIKAAYDEGFNGAVEKAQAARDAAGEAAEAEAEAADATQKATKQKSESDKTALARARERYELTKLEIEAESERLETARLALIAEGKLSKDEAAKERAQRQIDVQEQLAKAFLETFKAQQNAEGAVVSVGFKIDKEKDGDTRKVVADIAKQYQNILQSGLNAKITLLGTIDPKEALEAAKESLKFVNEAFKSNSEELAEGLIDPTAFGDASQGLADKLQAVIETLRAEVKTNIAVQLDPKLRKDYEDQIDALIERQSKLGIETANALRKAEQEAIKGRVDANKVRLELLKEDEEKNAAAIEAILRENLALETQLKLASLKSTGELREQETKKILADAAKQKKALDEQYKQVDLLDKVAGKLADKITAAFQGPSEEDRKKREESIKLIEEEESALIASMKSGEIARADFAAKIDELRAKREELGKEPGILDRLTGAVKKTALDVAGEKITKFKEDAIKQFQEASAGGQLALEQLGLVIASTFGGGIVEAIRTGEASLGKMLRVLADTVISALDMLVPIITGQFLGFLGPFALPAATIAVQGLKALLSAATSSIGADQGVIDITNSYRKRRSRRDTIPLWVRRGESVITPEGTRVNKPWLALANRGVDVRKHILSTASRDDLRKSLNFDRLGITFADEADKATRALNAKTLENVQLVEEVRAMRHDISAMRADIRSMRDELEAMRMTKPVNTTVNTNITIPRNESAFEKHTRFTRSF